MADIDIKKAPPNWIVLPFYGTGALVFLGLSILMCFSTNNWNEGWYSPHFLAIAHTEALGWGSMVIFGSAYQILPVICEKDLFSPRLAFTSYVCLTLGAGTLVLSFWLFQPGWIMVSGGFLVVTSAILYCINAWFTLDNCPRYRLQKLFILTSAAWLIFTTLAGWTLAINLAHPFLYRNHLDLLKLHAHAGLAGWFLQLITGISTKLVPMFLLGKSEKRKLLYTSYALQNSGLCLFILDGLFNGLTTRIFIYEALIAAGVIAWLAWLFDSFRHRARKPIDWPMRHVLLSNICLLAAFLLLPLLFRPGNSSPWTLVYGLFLFQGWLTLLVLGMTFKTLPFIVWNERYRPLNGKVKVPMPKHLFREKWLPWQFGLHCATLAGLILGILLHQPIAIRLAAATGIATALLYTANVFIILSSPRIADPLTAPANS